MAIAMYFITIIVRRIARSVLHVEAWTPIETRCYQNVSLMEAGAEYMSFIRHQVQVNSNNVQYKPLK